VLWLFLAVLLLRQLLLAPGEAELAVAAPQAAAAALPPPPASPPVHVGLGIVLPAASVAALQATVDCWLSAAAGGAWARNAASGASGALYEAAGLRSATGLASDVIPWKWSCDGDPYVWQPPAGARCAAPWREWSPARAERALARRRRILRRRLDHAAALSLADVGAAQAGGWHALGVWRPQ
jgi:hypothetical protein